VLGGGVLLGPLLGGIAAQELSFRAPFAIAAGVLITACVVQAWLLAADRAKQAALTPVAAGRDGQEE